jgi:hypothetical protein
MTALPTFIILKWTNENPHAVLQLRHQCKFQINVLAGMLGIG